MPGRSPLSLSHSRGTDDGRGSGLARLHEERSRAADLVETAFVAIPTSHAIGRSTGW